MQEGVVRPIAPLDVEQPQLRGVVEGGYAVTEDAADPEKLVEWFMVESWAEHLRQHHRVSKADADTQEAVRRFHAGPGAPVVRHFLTITPSRN